MQNDLKIVNIGDYIHFEYSGKFSDENAIIAMILSRHVLITNASKYCWIAGK